VDVQVEIDSVAVRQMLTRAPAQIDRASRRAMGDALKHLSKQLKTYPPKRRNSTYVRTMALRDSWSSRIEGSGADITGIVGSNANSAPYNRLVQDATRQAPVHRGRWTNTAQAVSERSRTAINDMFQNRLRAELR
jgi:hypothetical protein